MCFTYKSAFYAHFMVTFYPSFGISYFALEKPAPKRDWLLKLFPTKLGKQFGQELADDARVGFALALFHHAAH